jgi:hypothetical protein
MLNDISPTGSQQVISSLKYPPPGTHLKTRVLRVEFNLQSDNIVLDETLNMGIQISKQAISVQSHAVIDITNMSQTLRQYLMSHFTAYDRRIREAGLSPPYYANVWIKAGYLDSTNSGLTPNRTFNASEVNHPVPIADPRQDILSLPYIFKGQVVTCTIVIQPPNMTMRVECFTNQLNQATDIVNQSPDGMTFREYVIWSGKQMGFAESNIYCKTNIDNVKIDNFARSVNVASQLIYYIERMDWPNISAYVDGDMFIVKNQRDVMEGSNILSISEFVGVPAFNEYGVTFTTLFTPLIQLGQAVSIQSEVNPSVDGTYVVGRIEYDLHSRDTPFYMKVLALPPP